MKEIHPPYISGCSKATGAPLRSTFCAACPQPLGVSLLMAVSCPISGQWTLAKRSSSTRACLHQPPRAVNNQQETHRSGTEGRKSLVVQLLLPSSHGISSAWLSWDHKISQPLPQPCPSLLSCPRALLQSITPASYLLLLDFPKAHNVQNLKDEAFSACVPKCLKL